MTCRSISRPTIAFQGVRHVPADRVERPADRLAAIAVADVAATVCGAFGRAMPLAVAEALTRLMDSHRLADARELANVCERTSPGIAAAIDVALRDATRAD